MPSTGPRLFALLAHPDDVEIFCGGTLALLSQLGWQITTGTMTAGNMGGIGMTEEETVARRTREAADAAAMIGANYVCVGERDGFMVDTPALRLNTARAIRRAAPDIVITHLPYDYHLDHRTTSNVVEIATMMATLPNLPCEEPPLAATPLLYHSAPYQLTTHLGDPVQPHFLVDIDAVVDLKRRMLGCHVSQLEVMRVMFQRNNFIEELLDEQDATLGRQIGAGYAEAFWQHRGGGFLQDEVIQEALGGLVHRKS
ncbi:MAG: PIG-L family deacetylase [Rhodothermales bacterium]